MNIGLSQRAKAAQGQPIGTLMAQALKYPDLLSLAAGFVDNATLPCDAVARCAERLCGNEASLRVALQYDTTAGNLGLRDTLNQLNYANSAGGLPDVERLILTSGSNQFLHLLSEVILDPGDIVIAAAPTYFVYMGTLRGMGVRVIGVKADEDGICVESLKDLLATLARNGDASRVKAIYSVTEFDNPAGSSLSLERRHEIITLLSQWRKEHSPVLFVSDNAYQLLRYEGEPTPSFLSLSSECDEFVVELGTFSKSLSPGIRVGWGIVPIELVRPLLDMKSSMDFGSPHFSQMLVKEILESGEFERHLPQVLKGYRAKRDAMLAALDEEFADASGVSWRHPKGGLYVWLTLPNEIDASESGMLWKASTESGVLYVPGHYCYPTEGEPVAKNTIRLSYGVQSADGIQQGIRRLAGAFNSLHASV